MSYKQVSTITKKWGSQKPPIGSQVNWGHPLSKNLVACFLMNEGGGNIVNDLTKNANGNLISPALWSNRGGLGIDTNATSSRISCGTSNKMLLYNSPLTIIMSVNPVSINVSDRLIHKGSSTTRGVSIFENTTNRFVFNIKGSTELNVGSPDNSLIINSINTIGVTWDGTIGSNVKLYKSGKKLIPASVTDGANLTNNILDPVSLGNTDVGTTNSFNGIIYYVYIYSRVLSPSEIQQLYQEPYCFIAPYKRRIFVQVSGVTPGVAVKPGQFSRIKTISRIRSLTI